MSVRLKQYLHLDTNIAAKQFDLVFNCFKRKTITKNTILLAEGEICTALYFVHSGCLRTYYLTKQGTEKTRYIALDGMIATSISSFISQQPSFEFIDAPEQAELYVISHQDFYRLVDEVPEWGNFYRKLLEMAYLYQNKKIEDLMTLSAGQRYEKLLSENPAYTKRVSNKILASYLDMTQETLSRLKSK